MSEMCDVCGLSEKEHDDLFASQSVDFIMMQQLMRVLPKEYATVLENILVDWRTHAVPECNPLAVK